jgi:ornithine cyclodeaminase/alanine dehydrogenase-like protein (mu-crystallin family)
VTHFEEAAIRAALGPGAAVRAVREAFRADGLKQTTVPAVINLSIPRVHGEFHVKSAYVEGVPYVAVKVASGFYDNAALGLPTGTGLMLLFDAATGMPSALLLDQGYLTDLRTGAAGAIAAEVLAPASVETVGVIGSGVQARHQVACLREVRRFARLLAWSPNAERLARYCAEMRERWGLDVRAAANPEEVVRAADLLVTATPARAPIVRADWLRPGVHITAVGADSPGKQELEPRCLGRADRLVVDRLPQCAAFGELAHAPGTPVHAELGEIVAGLKPGRTDDRQITIADLTGVGFQDTVIASAAYAALSKGQ